MLLEFKQGDQGDSLDAGRSSHLYHLLKKGKKASRDDRYEEVVICPLQQNEPLYYTSIDTPSVKRTPEHKRKAINVSLYMVNATEALERKKRKAKKGQIRAELRAQKADEQKENKFDITLKCISNECLDNSHDTLKKITTAMTRLVEDLRIMRHGCRFMLRFRFWIVISRRLLRDFDKCWHTFDANTYQNQKCDFHQLMDEVTVQGCGSGVWGLWFSGRSSGGMVQRAWFKGFLEHRESKFYLDSFKQTRSNGMVEMFGQG
ncbi:hypothetical protein Tco_1079369 [Tanacetum coccineum]|uniref:Uncharacterized protein n=1 Tax=Tanacetum coccineum TaxID=301880 RepID=A0ABQ5HSZ2_9ASTR